MESKFKVRDRLEAIEFDKEQYGRVINTQFRQFINQQVEEETPIFTLEDFFTLYDQLFFQIPKEGDINSHRAILEREAEYLKWMRRILVRMLLMRTAAQHQHQQHQC